MKTSNSLVRSKTRKMFINRVKNERDSGRFEARGEQMMMMEHLADKRKWEESMARDAGNVMPEFEADEDNMLPGRFCLILLYNLGRWLIRLQMRQTCML